MSSGEDGSRYLWVGYLALLLWMPLPFGSNVPWAWSLMEAWLFLLAGAWIVQFLRGRVALTEAFVRAWPVALALVIVVGWTLLQSLPLPGELVRLLSPRAAELQAAAGSVPSISLEAYATRQSAVLGLAYLGLFCLTLLLVGHKRRVRVLLFTIVAGGVFQAAYGSLLSLSGLEHGFATELEAGGAATGSFVNRNHLAGNLTMCLAAGVGLMLSELSTGDTTGWRDNLRRWLRTILGSRARVRLALVVMVMGLVLTRSRMGNAAFLVGLFGVGLFYLQAVRKLSRPAILFFASLLVVDLLVVGNIFGIDQVAERIQQTSLEGEDRVNTNRDSLVMLRDFPATGIGAGAFYAVYPNYTSVPSDGQLTRHAHNDYLQFACEFGLAFAALLGAAVLACLWTAIQAQLHRRDALMQGAGFASTMAIVAILVHSSVDFNLQIPANAALFMVMLALAWVSRYSESLGMSRRSA